MNDGDAFISDTYGSLITERNIQLNKHEDLTDQEKENLLEEAIQIVKANKRGYTRNSFFLHRYSFENHLYDPINIFFGLVYLYSSSAETQKSIELEFIKEIIKSGSFHTDSNDNDDAKKKILENEIIEKEIKSLYNFLNQAFFETNEQKELEMKISSLNCILDGTVKFIFENCFKSFEARFKVKDETNFDEYIEKTKDIRSIMDYLESTSDDDKIENLTKMFQDKSRNSLTLSGPTGKNFPRFCASCFSFIYKKIVK